MLMLRKVARTLLPTPVGMIPCSRVSRTRAVTTPHTRGDDPIPYILCEL